MLLTGKPVVESLREKTKAYLASVWRDDIYVAHFLLNDDAATQVYATLKWKYAVSVGISSKKYEMWNASAQEVLRSIQECNADDACVWIIVQLPVGEQLAMHETAFLTSVAPHKDIDGLSWSIFGNALAWIGDFIPATPRAVFEILQYYWYTQSDGEWSRLQWKIVTVISQSNLIWKPVALELMKRWATVLSCNERTWPSKIAEMCAMSDIIISATWVKHLLSAALFADKKQRANKIVIDVGRWVENGKAIGDTDREELEALGAHITPVPWGVWPVTIACVFDNIRVLNS